MLHPSGYCAYYNESSKNNLVAGFPCPECGKVAGHTTTCPLYNENTANENFKSTRSKLYNATAILWHISRSINFFTFTLPARNSQGIYQNSATCETTGDLAVTRTFSKLLENVAVNIKRKYPETVDTETGEVIPGKKFSYVWIAEAQMQRQKKFGGAGDIHYHLVTNSYVPIVWLTDYWSTLLQVNSKNCVHVESIPSTVSSIPSYLAKYLGKTTHKGENTQRKIVSRRIGASQDLTAYAPIKFNYLPEGNIIREHHFATPTGYETSMYYFNTAGTLARYGQLMKDEKKLKNTSSNKHFSNDEIAWREVARKKRQALLYSKPLNLNNHDHELCNEGGNETTAISCPF
jgi:hypothetical protein